MKKILFLISFFLLSACDMPKSVHYMSNTYFNELISEDHVTTHVYAGKDDSSNEKRKNENYPVKEQYFSVQNEYIFLNEVPFELSHTGGFMRNFIYVNFYQDKQEKCFLYRYSLDDLINMKKESGLGYKDGFYYDKGSIFLIERDGLRVVSRAEYERLKPTFKPHPFDPSLCQVKKD